MLEGRTIILGGSFNPPHIAHQMTCIYLLQGLGASEVWVMPANSHPLGKELISFHHRLEMCKLMAKPLGASVVVSEVESELGGQGRTFDLLGHLLEKYPTRQFALSIGADILAETDKWHRWTDICEMVEVVALGRKGYPRNGGTGVLDGGQLELPEVSSSQIRDALWASESVEGLVPCSILDYIRRNNLYCS